MSLDTLWTWTLECAHVLKVLMGLLVNTKVAVPKAFNVCTVNLAPYYSKEARKMFADLAMGEKSMATEFYADLRSPTHANSSALAENTDNSANSSALAETTEIGDDHDNHCSSL